MAQVKHSRQRDAIKNFLISRKDHPTAETVYSHVKAEYPNISLGTVYRNLTFLVDHGEAIKISCDDDSIHFDGNPLPHPHFKCRKCGAVLDLEFDNIECEKALIAAASTNFPGTIEGNINYFYGLCPDCAK